MPKKHQKSQSRRREPTWVATGAAAIGLGAAALALFFFRRRSTNPAEHAASDLAADAPPVDIHTRAPDAFRPDPTAPVPPELRESLRPAPGFTVSATTGGQDRD